MAIAKQESRKVRAAQGACSCGVSGGCRSSCWGQPGVKEGSRNGRVPCDGGTQVATSVWLLLGGSMEQGRTWQCSGAVAAAGPGRMWTLPPWARRVSFLGLLAGGGPMGAAACVPCGSAACRPLTGPAATPCVAWALSLLLWWILFRSPCRAEAATSCLFRATLHLQY